jgi:proline dehydrogenase
MAGNRGLVKAFSAIGRSSGLTRRFIAGEDLDQAIHSIQTLSAAGLRTTLDLLGEGVTDESEADSATKAYLDLLRAIKSRNIPSGISIKLTQLGLDIDRELCSGNLKKILEQAKQLDRFVRIDMEASKYTQATLDLFLENFSRYGSETVGIVIQAYLYRSEEDIENLTSLGCNIRLCKGAYMEPPEVAFPEKRKVDENFKQLVERMLHSNCFSAIATHDEKMIQYSEKLISSARIPETQFEFQMLFGVRRERQIGLKKEGYPVRVYVPFGTEWAPYFMRRLAERPANLLFVIKNLFRS